MKTTTHDRSQVKSSRELVVKNCPRNSKKECLRSADDCPDPIYKRRILSRCVYCYVLSGIAENLTAGEASAIVAALADESREMSPQQIGERAGVKAQTVRYSIKKYLSGMSQRYGMEVSL